jgi:hypothetical protein
VCSEPLSRYDAIVTGREFETASRHGCDFPYGPPTYALDDRVNRMQAPRELPLVGILRMPVSVTIHLPEGTEAVAAAPDVVVDSSTATFRDALTQETSIWVRYA